MKKQPKMTRTISNLRRIHINKQMGRHTAKRFYRISHFKNIRSKTFKRFTKKRLKRPRCKTENKKKITIRNCRFRKPNDFLQWKNCKKSTNKIQVSPTRRCSKKIDMLQRKTNHHEKTVFHCGRIGMLDHKVRPIHKWGRPKSKDIWTKQSSKNRQPISSRKTKT